MSGQSSLLPPRLRARRVVWKSNHPLLGRLKFDDEVLERVRDALRASHADERREHIDDNTSFYLA
jgi:hypothetical protein